MSPPRADEVALELIKQIVTLASGVLALSAAFIGTLPPVPQYFLCLLALSWAALVVSILCGLKTISAIVKSRLDSNDSWSGGRGKRFAQCSHYSFLAGIAMFAAFAFLSLVIFSPKNDEAVTIRIDDPRIINILRDAVEDRKSPPTQP